MFVYAIIVPAYANRVDQICVYEAPINYMTSLVYGHTHDDNWPSYLTSVGCRHTHAAIHYHLLSPAGIHHSGSQC